MTDRTVRTLSLLARLREAEAQGARARLAQANETTRARAEAETQAGARRARLEETAERYVSDRIAEMGPTRDGASVYASLAYGARQSRQDAAGAGLQHRRAVSRLGEAREDAETAAARFLEAEARRRALALRRAEARRADSRRADRREEDRAAEGVRRG